MSKRIFNSLCVLSGLLLAVCMTVDVKGSLAQETKQLKEPVVPQAATNSTPTSSSEAVSADNTEDENALPADAQSTDELNGNPLTGTGTNRSYSIVVENRIGPDGKRIQTKKVWKDGNLVEDTENTIEPGQDADAGIDITGEEDMNGPLLDEDITHGMPTPFGPGNPFEAMQAFEQQMLQRQRAQFEQLQQLWSQQGMGGPFRMFNSAGTDLGEPVPQKLSDYWIGASVQPVPEQVASYLDLEPGVGIMVIDVLPDSPAARAGLQKRDILLTLGETPLTNVWQIGKILDDSQGATQKIGFLRQGKEETAELTPEKRPEQENLPVSSQNEEDSNDEAIRVVRPGIIIPRLNGDEEKETDSAAPATEAPNK